MEDTGTPFGTPQTSSTDMAHAARRLLPFVLVVAASSLVRADEIDDLVASHMAKSKAPGVAIAIVRDGKVVRAQGYGMSNVELGTPVTPHTAFRVASMSKNFAAASMLLLEQQGKVKLDDSVRTVLKDAPEAWQPMTFRHLLNHTSGIPEIESEDGFSFTTNMSGDRYLKVLFGKPLAAKPGDVYSYSNPGYSVLGLIVQKISGKSLESFVQEHFFGPAQMTNTRYYTPGGIVANRAAGYEREGEAIENALFLRPMVMQGSGGVISTVLDYAKWDAALRTNTVFSAPLQTIAYTAGKLNDGKDTPYGMGWFVYNGPHGRIVSHSGGTVGFTSNWVRYLDKGLTVIVLENIAGGQAVALSREIAESLLKAEG